MLNVNGPGRQGFSASILAGLLSIAGSGGEVVDPEVFVDVLDPGGQFGCDAPKGWEVDKGGKADSSDSFLVRLPRKETCGSAMTARSTSAAISL